MHDRLGGAAEGPRNAVQEAQVFMAAATKQPRRQLNLSVQEVENGFVIAADLRDYQHRNWVAASPSDVVGIVSKILTETAQ